MFAARSGARGRGMTTLTAKLDWKGDDLYFARRKLFSVVRDEKYSNMWRVLFPDGRVSDMANRTRAKDAALGHARRMVDAAQNRSEAASEGCPVRSEPSPLPPTSPLPDPAHPPESSGSPESAQ